MPVQGAITATTAYYPVAMVRSIVKKWIEEEKFDICSAEQWFDRLQAPIYGGDVYMLEAYALERLKTETPSDKDREEAEAWLHRLHRASGHVPNRQLARAVKDAGLAPWVLDLALKLHCGPQEIK